MASRQWIPATFASPTMFSLVCVSQCKTCVLNPMFNAVANPTMCSLVCVSQCKTSVGIWPAGNGSQRHLQIQLCFPLFVSKDKPLHAMCYFQPLQALRLLQAKTLASNEPRKKTMMGTMFDACVGICVEPHGSLCLTQCF